LSSPARAQDKDEAEREAAEAQAEEETERNNPNENLQVLFTGKLRLYQEPLGQVLGEFTCGQHTYLVKAVSEELKAALRTYDGKEVTLIGRPRNKEKYLEVRGIQPPGAPPQYVKRRAGL
jgi:hypothetical protein